LGRGAFCASSWGSSWSCTAAFTRCVRTRTTPQCSSAPLVTPPTTTLPVPRLPRLVIWNHIGAVRVPQLVRQLLPSGGSVGADFAGKVNRGPATVPVQGAQRSVLAVAASCTAPPSARRRSFLSRERMRRADARFCVPCRQGLNTLLELPGIKQLADLAAGGARSNSWV